MSYSIKVVRRNAEGKGDPSSVIELKEKHGIAGGTYCVGGTERAEFNITYNYAKWFYQLWPRPDGSKGKGEDTPFGQMFADTKAGIRSLYDRPLDEVIAELDRGVNTLQGDPDPDYWKDTEGNARAALFKLKLLCEMVRYENPDADLTLWGD